MRLKELYDKYGFRMHYTADQRQLHIHAELDCEVLAYAFGGDIKHGRHRSWVVIYQGPRSIFAAMCGNKVSLSSALRYLEGFGHVIDAPEKSLDFLRKQIAIEKL
jgi:hypothetical protein